MVRIRQGQTYTVQVGDTLARISNLAYGIPGNRDLIKKANQFVLKGTDEIQPGENIFIPYDPVIQNLRNSR